MVGRPCPVQIRDKSFLPARLLCCLHNRQCLTQWHAQDAKQKDFMSALTIEQGPENCYETQGQAVGRLGWLLHFFFLKKSMAGRGRSVRKNDEGPWICYRSLLRNGTVLPQPLKWRMEIRTHAWPAKVNWWIMYASTSTVLIKYPQVQLELTCSGTILIKTACRKEAWATLK